MQTKKGSTKRIQNLRQQSTENFTPSISMERAVLITEAYKTYEGKHPAPVLRGLVFKHIMENRTLYFEPTSLIQGEKGHKPWAAPTFPELCCHSLEDLDNMNEREKVFFRVTEEDKQIQKDVIIPYWKDRAMMTKMNDLLPSGWQDLFSGGLYTEFLMQRGPGHTVADGKIYQKGYLDFIDDIEYELKTLDYLNDKDALNKRHQLEGMKLVCEGMIIMGERYAALAGNLAAEENDPERKNELL